MGQGGGGGEREVISEGRVEWGRVPSAPFLVHHMVRCSGGTWARLGGVADRPRLLCGHEGAVPSASLFLCHWMRWQDLGSSPGDGGSFVGALRACRGPGSPGSSVAGVPTGFLTPALPPAPRFPSDLHLPPPAPSNNVSPKSQTPLRPQGTAVPSSSVSWSSAEAPLFPRLARAGSRADGAGYSLSAWE